MDKLTLLLFNNRKALGYGITEKTIELYKSGNNTITVHCLAEMYDETGNTWEINDGFLVGNALGV